MMAITADERPSLSLVLGQLSNLAFLKVIVRSWCEVSVTVRGYPWNRDSAVSSSPASSLLMMDALSTAWMITLRVCRSSVESSRYS